MILVLVVGLAWGTVAQRRVKSLGIVAELDVAGHILAGVFPRRVGGAVDPLDFERGIERFREGIIEAGTHSAHRLADVEPGGGLGERFRRFFCDNSGCSSRTFAEQPTALTAPRARRTVLVRRMLMKIAVALAGRAGARLAERLGMPTSRDSLLRLLRTLPDPRPDEDRPRLLGIDDFALRRGHVYGTVVVDMISDHPVDLLPDRQSSTVAAWLEKRPEVEVICRDRAGAYAEAAAPAAPQAVQVADRWHLWHNLAGHLERVVLAHRRCLRELAPHKDAQHTPDAERTESAPDSMAASAATTDHTSDVNAPGPELWIVTRTRERYQTITTLRSAGKSIAQIARELGLDRRTVRRSSPRHRRGGPAGQEPAAGHTAGRLHRLPAPALGRGLHRRHRAGPRDRRPGLPRQHPDRAHLPTPAAQRTTCPTTPDSGTDGTRGHQLDPAPPRHPRPRRAGPPAAGSRALPSSCTPPPPTSARSPR